MSFWDVSFTAPSPGASTPPPQTAGQPPPTLNEEVTEVIGQLGQFWGGFRRQGQSAIQAARKDLGDYVSQAQQGINEQLATLSISSPSSTLDTDTPSSIASSSRDLNDSTTTDGESSRSSSTSASTATLPDPKQQQQQQQQQQVPPTPTFLGRLQTSLPPDLLNSIRDTIPDSVLHPRARQDLAHAAQARVQDAAARGEELLRGASIFLRDAVRVVPPEPATSSTAPHVRESASGVYGKVPSPVAIASPPATRRDALLRALRGNPAILRVDPAKEDRSAALFVVWAGTEADAICDESRRESELAADEGALGNTRSVLDREGLSEDEFWKRYFFRVHQIDKEDERRKAVLSAGPTDQDDDFSWEDEDEDAAPKAQRSPVLSGPVLSRDQLLKATVTSGTTSPERSDDSFDFVSSGPASAAGDVSAANISVEEPSDGDDEEEEEEEESDWE